MEQPVLITRIPKKRKRRLSVLRRLVQRFEPGRDYTEKEVNRVLQEAYPDHVTLRRYLIDDGLLDRSPDGSRYWVKSAPREPFPDQE